MAETEGERYERTGLSSLQMTDNESKAVQKTPNRVSLESILNKIVRREYWHPTIIPHMTVVAVQMDNGYVILGTSTPADPANFDATLGRKFAEEDAIRQIWKLEAYLLREKLALAGPSEPV